MEMQYRLILTDFNMPVMDGIKATFKEKITRQDRANDHECNGEGTLEAFHREFFRQQIRFDSLDFSVWY